MNKQLLSILSIVVSIAIALGIYLYFAQIEDKSIKPIQIVPDNAAIIIESKNSSTDLKNLDDPTFLDRLLLNEQISNFYSQVNYYDSLLKTNETMEEWFSKGQATYSFHTFSNKSVGFFMAVQTLKEVEPSNAFAFFQTHFPNRYKLSKRKFMNEELFDFTDFNDGTHFTIAFKSKLMLFSPDGTLVELALQKINQFNNDPSIEDKLAFVKNSGDGLNIYFNYKNLPSLIQSTCSENYQQSFSILGNFAERAVYNVEYDDEELLLKGAAQTHETNFQYLDLLNSQAPIENNLRANIPDGIHFAYTLGFNGYPAFYKNVNEYLLSRKLFMPYKNYIDSIERSLQYPFAEKLASKFANHAAILSIDEPGLWKDSCYVMAVEVSDAPGMETLLAEMERSVKRKFASDTIAKKADTIQYGIIPRAYFGDALKFYFTDLFEGLEANYYIQSNGYFYFANNPQILHVMRLRWAQQKLLSKQEHYKDFERKLSPNSNLEILIMNDHAPKYALNFLNNDWFSIVNQNMGAFKRAHRMAIQFAGSNDKIFATQIYTHFNISKAEKTEQVWAIQLDTNMIIQPQVVYNYSLGSQVILTQDARKQVYMIDREGKILWKKAIDDQIISKIEEVDLYNNGKRQWVFNSSHFIYMIDDKGVNISGWPVWIPTGTNCSVSVIDPNKDRNYQLFATGIFYKVSAYNTQGRLLPYWNPKEVWPNLKTPIQHFMFGSQQVYWSLNEKGKINFLSNQAKSIEKIKLDSNYQFLDAKIDTKDTGVFTLTALDSNQLITITYSSTKPITVKTLPAAGFHHFVQVSLSSSRKGFLLIGNEKVQIIDEQGATICERKSLSGSTLQPQWCAIGNGQKLIYWDQINRKIAVENAKGEAYKPFPINTSGPFVIGNLFNEADNWLIFADENNKLNLYRLK
ncbi:MAG: hypothetical protein CFE21_06935 [Bacteroidetes bacterium B1(2017)]|nr:MAG: hypothetical protein CFE21_06935 [Bacteroidetes bacterium B1(2017)]